MKRNLMFGAVVVIIIAVVLIYAQARGPANNANFPEGLQYVCTDPGCGNAFTMTTREFGQHNEKHYGQPVPCPKCEKTTTARAERCPHCGHVHKAQRGMAPCPQCGKDLAGNVTPQPKKPPGR